MEFLSLLRRLLMLALVLPATAGAAADSSALAWPAVKAKIEGHWKTAYSTEKILNIEKKGGIEYSTTQRTTESTHIWEWIWETKTTEVSGNFARQVALVTVERANKTRARFEIAALFKQMGNVWQFAEMAVGKVEELPGAADSAGFPSSEAAIAIFTKAYAKTRPDFNVASISVLGKPEFHQSQERRWLTYKLAMDVTGTDKGSRKMYNQKYRCTPWREDSVLRWDDAAKTWVADEKMIQNMNEDRWCDPAK